MFQNVTIAGNSLFQGNIVSGPMVLSNDSPTGNQYTHNNGTNAKTIYQLVQSVFGFDDNYKEMRVYPVVGNYGTNRIIQIAVKCDIEPKYAATNYFQYQWYVYIYYEDGSYEQIANRYEDRNGSGGTSISAILSYQFTTNAKTFKLLNLPSIIGQENSGIVYAGPDKILRIS
jgi:hypothetical protein